MQFLFCVSLVCNSLGCLIFILRYVHCQQILLPSSTPSTVNFPDLPSSTINPPSPSPPANPNNNWIEYTLYTRSHMNQSLPINHTHLDDMVPRAPVVVLIHGWREHLINGTAYMDMKNAYLWTKEQNVIGMDWGQADDNIAVAIANIGNLGEEKIEKSSIVNHRHECFNTCEFRMRNIENMLVKIFLIFVPSGTDLTLLLLQIRHVKKIHYIDMHIIGHSLGGQIAGVAGRQILKTTGITIGRITGLDPARPFFEYLQTGDNLSKKDATMVDIVHTDAGVFGYHNAQGTVDFFPNGGIRDQPGCKTSIWQWAYIYMREMHKIFDKIACSHGKSKEYFLQSIYYPKIKALNCESWTDFKKGTCKGSSIIFGEYIPMDAKGQYFFEIDVTKKS